MADPKMLERRQQPYDWGCEREAAMSWFDDLSSAVMYFLLHVSRAYQGGRLLR